MEGGAAGAAASFIVEQAGQEPRSLCRVDMLQLGRGDRVTLRTAGAGGYGDPFRRGPQSVLDDVRRGLVSAEAARRDYGVAIAAGVVDEAATASLRKASRLAVVSVGPERAAWDDVFAPALLDRLATALRDRPVAARQAAKTRLYGAVLSLLPDGFPAIAGTETAHGEAHRMFGEQLAALEAATGGEA
jgi:N-methylhydantoinase B